jgi:hypothetical protein
MWTDSPNVHQDEVSAEMLQQRGPPMEDLRHEGSSLQGSRMSNELGTVTVENIQPESLGRAHQHNPCQCPSTILR